MDIESLCPFQAATVLWEPRAGEHRLTVCVKASLSLAHGHTATLAPQQLPPHDDLFWDRNAEASLYAPSDFAPEKSRADILLVGHAYAPGGAAVPSLIARLRVGAFVKALHIEGDRVWTAAPDGTRPCPSRPFTAMPLRYERAPAGPLNPIGVDPSPRAIRPGWPLANIYAVGETAPGTIAPSFGPTAPSWRARLFQHGRDIARWADNLRGAAGPAPPALDLAFFNAAPPDQQVHEIPAGAEIVLENLNPSAPVLATRLPALAPRAFRVSKSTGLSYEIPLRCDTLWIDGDRALAVVSFRGAVDIDDPRAIGRIVVATEPDDRPEPMILPPPAPPPPSAQPAAPKSAGAGTTSHGKPVNVTKTAEIQVPTPGRPPEPPPHGKPVNVTQTAEIQIPTPGRSPEPPPRTTPVNVTHTAQIQVPDPAAREGRSSFPFTTPSRPQPAASAISGRLQGPSSTVAPDISIARCAAITAALEQGRAPRSDILRESGVTEASWTAAERHWTSAIAADQASGELLAAFDAAYIASIERHRGPLRAEDYARLRVGAERGDPRPAIRELKLPPPIWARLERVWARRLASDPALAARVAEALEAERRR